MCTLTWWENDNAYGVLFNRDESRKRGVAEPPAVRAAGETSYICPIDPDGGGTWIWVNQHGVIGCILNNYVQHSGSAPADPVSRGQLLASFSHHKSVSSVEQALRDLDCNAYRGFYMAVFAAQSKFMADWNGRDFTITPADELRPPWTTSGYLPEEVVAYRNEYFHHQVLEQPGNYQENLVRFHGHHNPDLPAHSLLMSRDDARTVSQSRIVVEQKQINFTYATVAEDLCLQPFFQTTLTRD